MGNTGNSDKIGKQFASRRFRRKEKIAIYNEDEPPIDSREITDEWSFSKDGKHHFDEEEYPELMRK